MSAVSKHPGMLLGLPGKTGDKIAMKDPAIKNIIPKDEPTPAPSAPVPAKSGSISETILTGSGEAMSESQKKTYLGGF